MAPEKEEAKYFYVTTPIYYVNSEPHIGGVYTSLMADLMCRFNVLNGRETWFLTGTDEHGQKIQQSAQGAGMEEQQFVDMMAKKFIEINDYMNFGYSDFIRTTEDRHKFFVQAVWQKLVKNGWIYRGKYSGWYCVSDEAYYTEDDLVKSTDGTLRTSLGKTVEWREEDSYFFRLSRFQKILLELYGTTDFIQPSFRKNEVVAFVSGRSIRELETESSPLEGYLKDLSISRNNFSWGIKIPCDDSGKKLAIGNDWSEGIDEKEKHVIYVWLDALFNYQSALHSFDKFDKFWKNGRVVHMVGKDILRFHAVYWPALLIALEYEVSEIDGLSLADILNKNILPTTIFAHGWWTRDGKKMSKSLGNTLNVRDEIGAFVREFNLEEDVAKDYMRYFLATEIPFGADGDYSKTRFIEKINAELVNNIGNLIHRILMMLDKNFEGNIDKIEITPQIKIKNLLRDGTIDKFDYLGYRDLLVAISTATNGHLEQTAPWNLRKNGKTEKMFEILKNGIQDVARIAILLQVFCPSTAKKILDHLGIVDRSFSCLYDGTGCIPEQKLPSPRPFFPKLDSGDSFGSKIKPSL
jgi:methionyl-tRNA synthetase